jgi:hypothetical protein
MKFKNLDQYLDYYIKNAEKEIDKLASELRMSIKKLEDIVERNK